jgi:hypothetical protein
VFDVGGVPVVVPLDVPVVAPPEDVCASETPVPATSASAANAMRFITPLLSRRANKL